MPLAATDISLYMSPCSSEFSYKPILQCFIHPPSYSPTTTQTPETQTTIQTSTTPTLRKGPPRRWRPTPRNRPPECGEGNSLRKPVKSQPPSKLSPAILDEVADYYASATTSCLKIDVMSTRNQLISLIQKINWSKLLEVTASLLRKLLECKSLPQAELLLASHLQGVLAIFTNNK
ncbi:hypothetical protein Trydic_g4156 [Trypoxylus dichotomus]